MKEKSCADAEAAFHKLETFLADENIKYWHLVITNCFLPVAHLLSAQWAMNGVGTEAYRDKCKPHADQKDLTSFLKLKSKKRTFTNLLTMCCRPAYTSSSEGEVSSGGGKSIYN